MTDVVFKNEIKLGDKTLAVTGLTGNPQGDRLIRKDYNSVVVPASIETLGKGFISEATLGSLTFEDGSGKSIFYFVRRHQVYFLEL